MMIILGLFLFIPIVMALYVSFTNWNGNGSPFNGGRNAQWVGAQNYTSLFTQDGLKRANFMQSLNNNFWYVLFVVPLQTAVSFFLALIVNNKFLKGKGFFRTAFYFPSVTSSIAISVVFLFLFANSGAVNAVLSAVGIKGAAWFSDSRGLFHIVMGWFGAGDNPGWGQGEVLGRSVWDWFSGPVGGDVRRHHPGRLDHDRHLHADVPRGAAGRAASRSRRRPCSTAPPVGRSCATSPCRSSSRPSSS